MSLGKREKTFFQNSKEKTSDQLLAGLNGLVEAPKPPCAAPPKGVDVVEPNGADDREVPKPDCCA